MKFIDKIGVNTIALFCCVLWASPFISIKTCQLYVPSLELAFFRYLIAGGMLFLISKGHKYLIAYFRDHWRLILAVSVTNTSLLYSFFFWGMERVPSDIGALIVGIQPVIIALFSSIYNNEKISKNLIISSIVAFSGVVFLSFEGLVNVQVVSWGAMMLGFGLLLVNHISSAVGNIIIFKAGTSMKPLPFASFQMLLGSFTLLFFSLLFEDVVYTGLPLVFWGNLAWISFISFTAIGLWFVLLQHKSVSVAKINMWKFVIPAVGAMESWIFVKGEDPTWYTVLGVFVITGSILLLYTDSIKKMFKKKV